MQKVWTKCILGSSVILENIEYDDDGDDSQQLHGAIFLF